METVQSLPPRSPISRRVASGQIGYKEGVPPFRVPFACLGLRHHEREFHEVAAETGSLYAWCVPTLFAYQNWLVAPRAPLASRGPQRHLRPGWRHDWCAARSAPSRLFGQVLRALYRQCAVADNLTLSPGGVPSNTCSCNQSGGAAAHPSLAQEIRE